jgi:hypothetical protein
LYIARLPKISKYCWLCRSAALPSAKLYRKLVPWIGVCSIPSTCVGCGIPAA